MRNMARIVAGVAGTALAAAVTFAQAQAPQQPPAGRQGAPGAQAPAPAPAGQGGKGRGARGGGQAAQPMSFFITSVGKGDGGNLGGLAGADAHCAALAKASGAPAAAGRTWRAYLRGTGSAPAPGITPAAR